MGEFGLPKGPDKPQTRFVLTTFRFRFLCGRPVITANAYFREREREGGRERVEGGGMPGEGWGLFYYLVVAFAVLCHRCKFQESRVSELFAVVELVLLFCPRLSPNPEEPVCMRPGRRMPETDFQPRVSVEQSAAENESNTSGYNLQNVCS